MVSAALVTGNVVLFKPSERALVMGALLTQLLMEAGVPEGVLQTLPGGPEIGQALVTHPDVSMIAFTGSKNVGLSIIAEAAKVQPGQRAIKHVIAEMGGKNAIIIDDTADLDEAVAGVVASFTGYQGQKCSACSRAIVVASVYDEVLRRVVEHARRLTVGDPTAPDTYMGAVIDRGAWTKIRDYIAIGREEGRVVLGGETEEGGGYFIPPTIVADVPPEGRLACEEIFGPVLAFIKARDFGHATEIFNSTEYGLTGGLISRDPRRLAAAREGFHCGNLYLNRKITGANVDMQPFGGFKMSGIGRELGEYALQLYTEVKTVIMAT
jgi:acyl-CoA reductase-like NAD-dependent aldehyde dehydrogenase